MSHKWYAIQTYAGSEMAVKRGIENLVIDHGIEDQLKEVIVPTEDVIEIKNGKQKINERTLYPGYAFACLDLDTALWHKIQSLPKVGRFIGEAKKPKIFFEDGESVRITEGPFANFTGIVEEYDMIHGKLRLNVSIFGRSTPVDILYSQVEKII